MFDDPFEEDSDIDEDIDDSTSLWTTVLDRVDSNLDAQAHRAVTHIPFGQLRDVAQWCAKIELLLGDKEPIVADGLQEIRLAIETLTLIMQRHPAPLILNALGQLNASQQYDAICSIEQMIAMRKASLVATQLCLFAS